MKPRIMQVVLDLQFVGEKMVAALVRRLAGEFSFCFCCLDRVGLLGERLREEGFPVFVLHRRPGVDWLLPRRIARLARRERIDVLHVHHYTPFFYTALSRVLYVRPRLLFTEHGRNFPDVVRWPRRMLNRLLLRHLAHRVTAVCEFSRQALCRNDGFRPSQVEVVYNGVEVEETPPDEAAGRVLRWIGDADEVIGFLARLDPIKDPLLLIEAFARVVGRFPRARLVIMGMGPLREEAERRCEELGIADRVLFAGLVGTPLAVLPRLRALAVTSLCEAASLSILEAMACGVPVVATDVGGNRELVTHGRTGLLVSRSAEEVADALAQLLSDPGLAQAMGEAARREVATRFSLDAMVQRYRAIYRDLLE